MFYFCVGIIVLNFRKDKEINRLGNQLEQYCKELSRSEEKSRAFLVQAGIITENGNLRKPYKNLYLPKEQDWFLDFMELKAERYLMASKNPYDWLGNGI